MFDNTIDWVKSTEKTAQRFYEKALESFGDDAELAVLLKHLAEDEKKHHEMVSVASGLAGKVVEIPRGATVDPEVMSGIGTALRLCENRLTAGRLTKDGLIDAMVTIEFSECNEIFLYVITVMKAFPGEFRNAVAEIKRHKNRIEKFLADKPEYAEYLDRIRLLPDPAGERILVVDDEEGMLDVYEAFLSQTAMVESAVNGGEALEKIKKRPSYSAIVTDVDMPVMDGTELYMNVCEQFPQLKDRFIFLTGTLDHSRSSFFKKNNLRCLMKPVSIMDIKTAVLDIIAK